MYDKIIRNYCRTGSLENSQCFLNCRIGSLLDKKVNIDV